MRTRWRSLTESLRTGFWAVPTACVLVALVLSFGLVRLDRSLTTGLGRLTFGAGADGAREVLSAITTSMITFTGLVFSITIVVLQLTSSQFSPRVLRTFLRDRQTQLSLGVFIATFVYAVLVLRTVSGLSDDTFVPAVATTVGVVLLLVSVGVFVGYIHHVATAIQVSSILSSITGETSQTLDRQWPPGRPVEPPLRAPTGLVSLQVPAPRSGVLTTVDGARLVERAEAADVVITAVPAIGAFVPEGAPLLAVQGDPAALDVRAVLRCVTQGRDRTMQSDVAFGFRQLADIAARALSPGVNDPTTAVQALDGLHDLLRRVVTRPLPHGVLAGTDGLVRVVLPAVTSRDLLALSLDEVEQYGADSLQVQQRVDALLVDLLAAALPQHRDAVRERIDRR